MIQAETAKTLVDSYFNIVGGFPSASRSSAKAFVKWMKKYFGIELPSEIVLNNRDCDSLVKTLSENIEYDEISMLNKIIAIYAYAFTNDDFLEEIDDIVADALENVKESIAEEIISAIRNKR